MNYVMLVLLLVRLLQALRRADSEDDLALRLAGVGEFGDGELLRWLWANRQEIIELVKEILRWINGGAGVQGTAWQVDLPMLVAGIVDDD